jgi:capsular polysaccharide transport system permease protein
MTSNTRSSLAVTYETWQALFLREAITRLSMGRAAVWIILDPIVQIVFMLLMFSIIRMKTVGGIDTSIWLMVGILSYNTFKGTMNSGKNAVKANQILFTYRQIKPIDTVLVKAAMEFLLKILVAFILFSGVALFGIDVLPENPLTVLEAVFGLWLIGLGSALILSVVEHLVPETAKITTLVMMPLYMCSGVIFPISAIPAAYRDWLVFNPLVHGVEAARLGFAPYYHAIPELSIGYLYGFAIADLFLGLALHVRFSKRLLLTK